MPRSLKKRSAFLVSLHFFVPNICMFTSVFLLYLSIYSIHFLECIKVCRVLNQHNLFYLTCMNVLKACNLLAITYARLDNWFLIFFIICLCNCLFLK